MSVQSHTSKAGLLPLSLAALGVVYGDIGTSPLYAFQEAFAHGMAPSPAHVMATLSMLFWSVMLIVSFKYVAIVLRFDNAGEGGVLALTALAHRLDAVGSEDSKPRRWSPWIIAGGIFAAALFYGDAMITPAISVLSAVEGIGVATPRFQHMIVPITIAVIFLLFLGQRFGTQRVGALFGPITVVWFLALAALGAHSIVKTPEVLYALDPMYALSFALNDPTEAFLLLSAVFLAMTGGEALYADMGHFGAQPVRLAWYGLVCPALMINYFGQGALVIRDATAASNPFYLLAPDWFLVPLVILATAATVIASQATITGAYSMTLQASRLGYLPRIHVLHTSDTERGQIYVPTVNWLMLVAVIWLVLEFRSSSALAAAYGIAVSGTMIITTLLTLSITLTLRSRFRLPLLVSLGVFFVLELLFFASNLTKLTEGGWLPLTFGGVIFLFLTTWKRGSAEVSAQRRRLDIPMSGFVATPMDDVPRVPGTAIYLTSDPDVVPSALFHNLKHYKVMHERTVFLNVVNEEIPRVDDVSRLKLHMLAPNLYAVSVHFGFREEPDVPAALAPLAESLQLEQNNTTYFVARAMVVEGETTTCMSHRRAGMFAWMTRQAESAASYFNLPANQVVELGTQVMI
ncbi:MAG TPA: potassium transporter Kup [Rhodocyclaceae bacterium]|nr:potassium transporter Kup [Rhodocyclaceae bacterium]